MTRKKVAILGICIVLAYLCITIGLCISGVNAWVTAMELITIVSGIFMPIFIMFFPNGCEELHFKMHRLAVLFATACMICTVCAHTVSLSVTQILLKQGVALPGYFLIGKWPSIEMTVDYLGWGLFMGLSFLFASFSIVKVEKTNTIKHTSFICAILCLVGFFGAFLINENFWYIAPLGYGLGSLVISVMMIFNLKNQDK